MEFPRHVALLIRVYTSNALSSSAVTSLAIEPSNPSTLYAAANGVYKTTDAGDHWTIQIWRLPRSMEL